MLKTGDKVRVIKDTCHHCFPIGAILTVGKVVEGSHNHFHCKDKSNTYDINHTWCVSFSDVEKVEEEKSMFKVGDKIVRKSGETWSFGEHVATISKIEERKGLLGGDKLYLAETDGTFTDSTRVKLAERITEYKGFKEGSEFMLYGGYRKIVTNSLGEYYFIDDEGVPTTHKATLKGLIDTFIDVIKPLDNEFKVGDKVIPHDKTIWGDLDSSIVWKRARDKGQPYLYVATVEGNRFFLNDKNERGGDFFKLGDFTHYVEEAQGVTCPIGAYPVETIEELQQKDIVRLEDKVMSLEKELKKFTEQLSVERDKRIKAELELIEAEEKIHDLKRIARDYISSL